MINNYYNYVRNLLTIIAMLFVYGNVYAQTSKTINAKEVWNYKDFTIGESYTITYNNKSFAANTWEFIGLPFDASKAVLDETFGENNYQIQQFNSMDGNTFVFKAMETPSITAGYPYLIKVTEAVSNPVFANVNFSTGTPSYYGNENVQLYASLITMAGWDLINTHNAYKLINGVLTKMVYNGEGTPEQSDILPPGGYVKTANNSVPSLSIEGSSGSGGGDDPIDPSSMTLQQKIAARMQLTDAPTVYITLPDIGDATLDSYLYKTGGNATTAADAPYRRASIKVVATDDITSPHYMESFEEDADHLEIKVRGNSTSLQNVTDAKRPYRLKFAKKDKKTGQDFKHDMTNAGYSKRNWVLLANAFDHSLIRNALTCELGKIVGMPFNPGYKFVDLVINGDYRGTYQISDHPEVDGNRINVDEDTGWYVEFQGRSDMCDYPMCFSENGYIMNIKSPEPADETNETERNTIINNVKDWFINTWGPSFDAGFTSPTTGWRAYNDEETLLKWWIITEITGDYDGMMTAKAYRESNGKLYWGPIWDKDLAYGNYSSMSEADGTLVLNLTGNGSSIQGKFQQALAKDPKFMAAVKAKMDALVSAGLKATLCSKIENLAAIVAQTEALNKDKWGYTKVQGGLEVYHGGVEGYKDYSAYIDQLKNWINARVDYVQTQINTLYTAANPETPEAWTYDVTTEAGNTSYTKDALRTVTMTNRTLSQNQWNAVSFPFDIDNTLMKSVFGDNFGLKEFSGVSEDGTQMLFTTPADEAIMAGVPYLLKPSKAVDASPIFSNVIPSASVGYFNSALVNGSTITYGNYTFGAHIFKANLKADGTVKLIGMDGTTLSTPEKENTWDESVATNGCMAYIKIKNSADAPTISFVAEEPAVRTQLTNLPTIYIDTKDNAAINPSSGDWTQAGIQVIDESNTLKPFVYAADAVTAKGKPVFQIRGRGAASWTNAEKKSYRIQFGKDDKDAAGNVTTSYKHYLLGNEDAADVVKKRNWVLLANAGDKTLVRNALTKKIGDIVGLPFTPGYQFVDLVLNGTYVGTYQVTEFIEADANRVNIDEDNGLLIQMTGKADTSTGDHIIAGTDYTKPYLTIKNPEIKTDQAEWNEAFNTDVYNFDAMWSATNGTGLDKSTLVNWYIASEITGNYEALSSIYAYLDATTKNLCFGPLWNNETAFDNHVKINMTSEGLMNDAETDDTHNGLLTKAGKDAAWKTKLEELWTRKWFAAAVYDRWKVLYNNGSLTTTLKGKVDNLAAIVNSSQALNFSSVADGGAGWTITGQGITDYSKDVTNSTYTKEVSRLKTYLEQRLPYLDKKFKALGEVNGPEITIGTGGYSSFSWNGALDFSGTGVEVYVATSYVKGILQLEKVADGKIPAETGVILKGNEGDKIYPQTISESVSLTATNILLNTAEDTFTVPSENSYYALATLNGKTALYKIQSGVTIPLNKAYLSVSVTPQQAPAAIFFGDTDGGTTGLNEISVNADSQHEAVYDLQGRRMKGNLAKGIYIKNGKKFIVK